ncbi:hypothetical protein ACQUY5_33305, partial [Bacillus cereus]
HGELKPDLEKGKHNTCTVEYCNNTYYCKGYCIKHYRQFKKHGRLTPELEKVGKTPPCKADGCEGKSLALGYCTKH